MQISNWKYRSYSTSLHSSYQYKRSIQTFTLVFYPYIKGKDIKYILHTPIWHQYDTTKEGVYVVDVYNCKQWITWIIPM